MPTFTPPSLSANLQFPIPGAAFDSKRLLDIQAVRDALVVIDAALAAGGAVGPQGPQGVAGIQGLQGETGLGFVIKKTYASVAALLADTAPTGIANGEFAIIDTGDVNNPDNAKLYLFNGGAYTYTADLSGTAGIKGDTGSMGPQGIQGAAGDTSVNNTYTKAQRGAVLPLTPGPTVTADLSLSNNYSLDPVQNFIMANPSNVVAGQSGVITITQDATGGRVVTWGSNWVGAGGVKPTLSTAGNAIDLISYYIVSPTKIFISSNLALA